MKFFALVAGAAAISRHHHSSHNYDSSQYYMVSLDAMMMNPMEDPAIMQNQPSHWRKQWPEGLTDQGQQDDTVVDRQGKYRGRKWTKPVPVVDYGHDLPLDGDIVDSQKHTEDAESQFEKVLAPSSYLDRGYTILNNRAAIKSPHL